MSGSGRPPLLRSEARRDGEVWVGRGEQAAGVGDAVWSSRLESDRVGSSLVGESLHRVGEVKEENCGEAVVRLDPSWLAEGWW